MRKAATAVKEEHFLDKEAPDQTFGGELRDANGVYVGQFLYIHHSDQKLLDSFCQSWIDTALADDRFFLTVDLETTGLNPDYDDVLLFSISWDGRSGVVFDPQRFDLTLLVKALSTCPLGNHKIKFDARFWFIKYGITPILRYCTMTMARLGYAGAWNNFDLASCVRNLMRGLALTKEVRENFIGRLPGDDGRYHFTIREIVYAAMDSVTTHSLVYPLVKRLRNENLWEIWEEVEQPLLQIVFDMEIRGVHIDVKALEKIRLAETAKAAKLKTEIMSLLDPVPGFKELQKKFTKGEFNPNSRDQIILVLELLGVHVPNLKAETVEELKVQHPDLPVIGLIAEYREVVAMISRYCVKWMKKHIIPETEKVHADFNLIVATGRMSCSDPPLQGINEDYRSMVIPIRRNARITSIDLSQYEFRALAVYSGEEGLLEAFHTRWNLLPEMRALAATFGDSDPDHFAKRVQKENIQLGAQERILLSNFVGADIHRRTAALVTGKDPTDVTSKERSIYKTLGYAVLYGAETLRIMVSLAQEGVMVNAHQADELKGEFFQRLPKVRAFVEKCHYQVEYEQVLTNLVGRKRYFWIPPKWKKWDKEYRERVLEAARREAVNFYPQSTNADGLKRAMIDIDQMSQLEYNNDIWLLIPIHDELVLEDSNTYPEIPERCAKILEVRGAEVLLNKCPVEVSIVTGPALAK